MCDGCTGRGVKAAKRRFAPPGRKKKCSLVTRKSLIGIRENVGEKRGFHGGSQKSLIVTAFGHDACL